MLKSRWGNSNSLTQAAMHNNLEVERLLLKAGAQMNFLQHCTLELEKVTWK